MHGLVNRAIERFTCDTYGDGLWTSVTHMAGLEFSSFEAMLEYDHALTFAVLDALAEALDKPRGDVLEDIGTYLVSAPKSSALRRLLRFSGTGFVDFLYSLDDLPARTMLAVPDLHMPGIELREHTVESFSLSVRSDPDWGPFFGHVMMGLLRAMADDYGALVFLEHMPGTRGEELVSVTLLDVAFAQARAFDLGEKAG